MLFKKAKDEIDVSKIHSSSQVPDWYFIRLTNYNYRELDEIKEWLEVNVLGKYKRIGWNDPCPYEVGVVFEYEDDAMAYKLTWTDGSGTFDDYDDDPLYYDEEDEDEEIWL